MSWSSSTNRTGFVLYVKEPVVNANVSWPGQPGVGHYRHDSNGAQGVINVYPSSGHDMWSALTGEGKYPPPQGSYDLQLTSADAFTNVSSGAAYTMHGSLDATLPRIGGGSTVTLHAVF